MLESLHIENIAIIRDLSLDFTAGFTVMTGETGAGKSIIIDAIGLLCGARGGRDVIRSGEEKATVTAVFSSVPAALSAYIAENGCGDADDGTVMLQRTVTVDGKSTAKCNMRPVSVTVLREIARQLIHIHGQNDNLLFLSSENHIKFLDRYAEIGDKTEAYHTLYETMCGIKAEIRGLQKSEKEKERLREMLTYQMKEIDALKLKPGEEETLTAEKERLKNIGTICQQTAIIEGALREGDEHSVSALLQDAAGALEALSALYPEAKDYAARLESCRVEIDDIADSMASLTGDMTADGGEGSLDRIESRLDAIGRLKRKYGSDIAEILSFRADCQKQLDALSNEEEAVGELRTKLKQATLAARDAAKEISVERSVHGERLAKAIMAELAYLDMEKVIFEVQVAPDRDDKGNWIFNENGIDRVSFLISTNPGEPLKPIDKVASGGELSRIMLATQCVLAGDDMQTMIFDEVDSGVSGKTSQKIGIKMRSLATHGGQILAVTHSAQIAALAHAHDFISKQEHDGRVLTTVTPLDRAGRIGELARIMGGIHITDTLLKTAEEMLNTAETL